MLIGAAKVTLFFMPAQLSSPGQLIGSSDPSRNILLALPLTVAPVRNPSGQRGT